MGFRALATALAGLAALIAAGTAQAAVYVYTGNNFTNVNRSGPTTPADLYTIADRVTITMTLAGPLAANLSDTSVTPTAFSLSDGVNTLTNANATVGLSVFRFWTNGAGEIVNWDVRVSQDLFPSTQKFIGSSNFSDLSGLIISDSGADVRCGPESTTSGCAFFGDPFYSQLGSVNAAPGAWVLQTDPAVVPLPAGAWLLLTGLAGLGAASARRKKAA